MIYLDLTAGVTHKYLVSFLLFPPRPAPTRPLHKAASRPAGPLCLLPVLPYDQPRHVAGPPAFILRRVAALTSLTGVHPGGGGGAVFPGHPQPSLQITVRKYFLAHLLQLVDGLHDAEDHCH